MVRLGMVGHGASGLVEARLGRRGRHGKVWFDMVSHGKSRFGRINNKEVKNMVYQWKLPIFKIEAQAAGEELERITRETGSLKPEAVVDASRDPSALLHECFEWDDSVAAENYRQTQAQGIIRNIVTVNVSGAEVEKPVRAFVNIQRDYKPIEKVMATTEYKDEMLENALRELDAFKVKYAALEQLDGVFASIDELKAASGL